jgi:hypothetical protein
MKTALKILGGIAATLVAAVVIFYVGWLSPPSADSVCDNIMRLTKAELAEGGAEPSDADLSQFRQACIADVGKEPEFGRLPWVRRLKCMRDAENMDGLQACESA